MLVHYRVRSEERKPVTPMNRKMPKDIDEHLERHSNEDQRLLRQMRATIPNGEKTRPGYCPEQQLFARRPSMINEAREVFCQGRFPASLIYVLTVNPYGQKTRRGPNPPETKQISVSNRCLGVRCLQRAGR